MCGNEDQAYIHLHADTRVWETRPPMSMKVVPLKLRTSLGRAIGAGTPNTIYASKKRHIEIWIAIKYPNQKYEHVLLCFTHDVSNKPGKFAANSFDHRRRLLFRWRLNAQPGRGCGEFIIERRLLSCPCRWCMNGIVLCLKDRKWSSPTTLHSLHG